MADEATGTTVEQTTQQPAAENAPASGRTYLQSDLDNIVAKVKESTAKQLREQWEAERAKEKMSEQEKVAAERDAEKAARLKAEAELGQYQRKVGVVSAANSLGYVPNEYLDSALNSADADAKPEDIAKTAHDKFLADKAKADGKAGPAPTPRAGAIASNTANDFAALSDAELQKLANEKGAKFYREFIQPEFERRRRAGSGRT